MIRIDATRGLQLDRALAMAGPASARRALDAMSGVLAIEVDGVDLTGGRAEGPLLAPLAGVLRALSGLQRGAMSAAIPLCGPELLLLLDRRGPQVLLTLVELGPPARVPVLGLAVDLAGLLAAAQEAADDLCRELAPLPGAGVQAARMLHGATRPARPVVAPALASPAAFPEPTRPWPPLPLLEESDPSPLAFDVDLTLEEEALEGVAVAAPPALQDLLLPGQLLLRVGGRTVALGGIPFLSLRDLAAGMGELARAVQRGDPDCTILLGGSARAADLALELDLGHETLSLDGAPPVSAPPHRLARAVGLAVARLERLFTAALPRLAGHPDLAHLRTAAEEAAAHLAAAALTDLHERPTPRPSHSAPRAASARPLAPGALRRLTLRPAWQGHVGPPIGPALVQVGGVLIATGREALLGRSGPRAWRAPGADWAALAGGLLLVRRADQLSALEPGTGRERWSRPLRHARPTGAAGRRGAPLLVGEPGALSSLDPRDGAERWRVELQGGDGLALAALGPLVAAGTGSGLLYGLDAEGRLAWRLRAPGPALAPPLLVGRALASLHAAGPGAVLLFVDPASGRRLEEVALDVIPAGALLRFSGGVALAGRSGGAAVVVLAGLGGRRWEVEAPLTGTPRLVAAGRTLIAADAAGAMACLGPGGRLAWSLPPAECAFAGGAPPVLARGVVVAARQGVSLLDAASGRLVGAVEGLPAWRLAVSGPLSVTALEADGAVTGLATRGHLSLVDGAAGPGQGR